MDDGSSLFSSFFQTMETVDIPGYECVMFFYKDAVMRRHNNRDAVIRRLFKKWIPQQLRIVN